MYLHDPQQGRNKRDRALADAVRSRMGPYVTHPGEIDVKARAGRVTLSGQLFSHEREDFVAFVRSLHGVEDVVDRLGIYETAEGLSELREFKPGDSTPPTHLVACAAGTTLALLALRGGVRGVLYGALGALLLLRVTPQPSVRPHTSPLSA
jgi:hypothetical protein